MVLLAALMVDGQQVLLNSSSDSYDSKVAKTALLSKSEWQAPPRREVVRPTDVEVVVEEWPPAFRRLLEVVLLLGRTRCLRARRSGDMGG